MSDAKNINTKRFFIVQCMAPAAQDIKKWMDEDYGFKNVYMADSGATISTHCGPGTVGIMYLRK